MNRTRVVVAVAAAALAVPVAAVRAPAASAADPRVSAGVRPALAGPAARVHAGPYAVSHAGPYAVSHAGPRAPAVAGPGAQPPFVPCPVTRPTAPVPPHPPKPVPPARDANRQVVGGASLGTAGLVVAAGAPAVPTNLTAASWLVADLDTGKVLGACGPHQQSPPASVQKLLLAATVLDKLDPNQVIQVNQDDVNIERGSSAVGLVAGGKYPISTLWLGLLLESGNDAAQTLARLGGGAGGVPATVAAMNAEAARLGALDTHAATPSGLDGPGQFTSAYDLALIARVDFSRPDFLKYTATQRAQMPPEPPKDPRGFQIQNENQLLTHYPGALGGKTGFTDLARHTYVGVAQRGGHRLVATLLYAEATPLPGWRQGAELLDWGFSVPAGDAVGRLVDPGETGRTPVTTEGTHVATAGPVAHAATVRPLGPWSPALVGGLVAAVAAVPLLVVVLVLRRRPAYAGDRRRGG